ncbi:MAG: acylphosphatase [Candidatus Moranbacteria bacterium]|nr:acylphosphatase [Candidatus Moranbacteria bacterium]
MNQGEIIRVRFQITGLVQGVNFRSSTCREAERLGVVGFVRNELDGSVRIEAEGSREAVEELLAFAAHGPSHARVDRTEREMIPVLREHSFRILR